MSKHNKLSEHDNIDLAQLAVKFCELHGIEILDGSDALTAIRCEIEYEDTLETRRLARQWREYQSQST